MYTKPSEAMGYFSCVSLKVKVVLSSGKDRFCRGLPNKTRTKGRLSSPLNFNAGITHFTSVLAKLIGLARQRLLISIYQMEMSSFIAGYHIGNHSI